MKKITLLVLIIVLVVSCKKDDVDSVVVSEKRANDINIVTGLELRAGPTDQPIVLGNPNERKFSSSGFDFFVVYPNPAIDVVTIKSIDNIMIDGIWMAKGIVDKSFVDVNYEEVLENATYADSELEKVNVLDNVVVEGLASFQLDLTNYEEGYYRVFVKTVKGVEWQNIIIQRSGGQEAFNELLEFWDYKGQ